MSIKNNVKITNNPMAENTAENVHNKEIRTDEQTISLGVVVDETIVVVPEVSEDQTILPSPIQTSDLKVITNPILTGEKNDIQTQQTLISIESQNLNQDASQRSLKDLMNDFLKLKQTLPADKALLILKNYVYEKELEIQMNNIRQITLEKEKIEEEAKLTTAKNESRTLEKALNEQQKEKDDERKKQERIKEEEERNKKYALAAEERRKNDSKRRQELIKQVKNEVTDLRIPEQKTLYTTYMQHCFQDFSSILMDELLENQKIWIKWPITLEDGSTDVIETLRLRTGSYKIADPIEPKRGNDIATLQVIDAFNIVIETPLRDGEVYYVVFKQNDIIRAIENFEGNYLHVQKLEDYYARSQKLDIQFLIDTLKKSFWAYVENPMIFIKEFIENVNRKIEERFKNELEQKTSEIMKDYAYVIGIKTKIVNVHTGIVYNTSDLKTFLNEYKMTMIHPITGVQTIHHPLDVWMNGKKSHKYNDETFYPGEYEGESFNTFTRLPLAAADLIDISLFIEFVKTELCASDEELYGACMTFLKKAIEDPAQKYGTGMAIIGDADRLKELYLKVWRRIFGKYYFKATSSKQLFGENLHLKEALVVEINDQLIQDSSLVMIDSLITDQEFSYNVKGGKIAIEGNYSKCIFNCSDFDFIAKTAKMDRLIKLEVSDAKAEDREYIDGLNKLISQPDFAASLMYYLQKFDAVPYEKYLSRPPVKVIANDDLQMSFTQVEAYLYHSFCTGEFEGVSAQPQDAGAIRVANGEMYNSFTRFIKENGRDKALDKQKFGKELVKLLKKLDLLISGADKIANRGNAKSIASLSKCQIAFDKYKKLEPIADPISDWKVAISDAA